MRRRSPGTHTVDALLASYGRAIGDYRARTALPDVTADATATLALRRRRTRATRDERAARGASGDEPLAGRERRQQLIEQVIEDTCKEHDLTTRGTRAHTAACRG